MMTYKRVNVKLLIFLTSTLGVGETGPLTQNDRILGGSVTNLDFVVESNHGPSDR
jgi:hypothetical protein